MRTHDRLIIERALFFLRWLLFTERTRNSVVCGPRAFCGLGFLSRIRFRRPGPVQYLVRIVLQA